MVNASSVDFKTVANANDPLQTQKCQLPFPVKHRASRKQANTLFSFGPRLVRMKEHA